MSLTRDNSHYQASNDASQLQLIAQDELVFYSDQVKEYAAQSISPNTRRAYSADLAKFLSWGGTLPCEPYVVAAYFVAHAKTHRAATIQRWKASISRAHASIGHVDPTKIEPAVSTLKGICRGLGQSINEARPLLKEDLITVFRAMGPAIQDKRDRALLLIGFGAGFRRSELVSLDAADIQFAPQGIILTLRRSKTDQLAHGRQIAMPLGRTSVCPVTALKEWLATASINAGPLFRPINRYGCVSSRRLSGEAVADIVKRRVAAVGIDPTRYSGHSLRAGFVTSAAQEGVPSWKIRQQTGHASDVMLGRYIRSAKIFDENATGALF